MENAYFAENCLMRTPLGHLYSVLQDSVLESWNPALTQVYTLQYCWARYAIAVWLTESRPRFLRQSGVFGGGKIAWLRSHIRSATRTNSDLSLCMHV